MTGIVGFAKALQVAQKSVQLYSHDHPKTNAAMIALQSACDSMLAERDRIQLIGSHGQLFVDGVPVEAEGLAREIVGALAQRETSGFVLMRGVLADELRVLVDFLMMRPQKIRELGGAGVILGSLPHIRQSQIRYEELREGEAIVSSKTLGGTFPLMSADEVNWKSVMSAMVRKAFGSGEGGGGANLTAARDELELIARGGGTDLADAIHDQLRQLPTEQQIALLFALPIGEGEALYEPMRAAGPALATTAAEAAAHGSFQSPSELARFLDRILALLPERDRGLELLREKLSAAGIDERQLSELIENLEWQNLDLEVKLQRALDGDTIFTLPSEKILTFFWQLLSANRAESFVKLLEKYGRGLFAESAPLRQRVADGTMQIASWLTAPGLPPVAVSALEKLLLTHFIRESDPKIHARCGEALELMLGQWLAEATAEHVYRDLVKIDSAIAAGAAAQPWKREAFDALLDRLCGDRWMPSFLTQLYTREIEQIAAMYPLLVFLADRVAKPLLRALENEEDRSRRGRLMKAIKVIGKPALQPIRASLASPTWYLVRNALNLLGDLVALDLVEEVGAAMLHEDPRVRRAAARSLGKIGTQRAESILVEALPREEPETQVEILGALGAMKAAGAVSAIGELARATRDLRPRAAEALAQIGSPEALPLLADLLMKKALLGGDSGESRFALARAIAVIGTPQARVILQKVVEGEPRGATRDQVSKLLEALPPA